MSGYGKILSAAQQVKHHGPAPTPAPVLVRDADARAKRQAATTSSSTTFTVTKAPDSTCGFLSGSAGAAITCENKKTCLWEGQYVSAIFCGFEDTDPAYLTCYPREVATNPASCNDVCQSNSFNLLCTDTASPYCRTYAYPGGVRDFRCAATPVTAPQSVFHTYSNQDFRTLTVSELGGPILSYIPSGAKAPTTTTGRGGATDTPTDRLNPTGRTTTTATFTPTDPPPPGGGGSSAPVGAIVGGVVGGLAVIGLLILGAFFLIRRNKKNQDLNTTDPQQPGGGAGGYPSPYGAPPPMQQTYGNVPPPPSESLGPVSPTSTYDPVFKHGSVAMASAVAPGQQQDEYNRMSYMPPGYHQTGIPQNGSPPPQSQGSPPVGYQYPVPQGTPSPQPMGPGAGYPQQQQQVYAQQGSYGPGPGQPVYEIGTVPDQTRGQVHEVS